MTFFIGEKYMFITPKLQFSHLGCNANPTTEADMVPDAVSVLRKLVGPTQSPAGN